MVYPASSASPTSGEVKVNGRVASLLEVGTGFHPELTGRENIYLNALLLGRLRREVDERDVYIEAEFRHERCYAFNITTGLMVRGAITSACCNTLSACRRLPCWNSTQP